MEPAAGAPAPASWIGLASGLVDLFSLLANSLGGSTVALAGRHEFDLAVVVPVVVPVHKQRHPLTGLVLAGKGPAWVIRPVFDRTEQGFRARAVIGDPRPGEGMAAKSDIFPESHRLGGAGEEALGEVLGGRGGYGSGLGDVAGAILLPTQ